MVSGGFVPESCVNGFVSALKGLEVGGVDDVIKRGKPPWSPSSKLTVAVEPTATSPKLMVPGVVDNVAGGQPTPR